MSKTSTITRDPGTIAAGIPGFQTGTWDIDPVHSDVSFSVRHMMVSKVKGNFDRFEGTITTTDDVMSSSVQATIDLGSVDTRNEQRDTHIRSADFLDVERYPTMTFNSTGSRVDGDGFVVEGELDLHGVRRPVELRLEVNGFGPDPYGGIRAGFTATTEINRSDFDVNLNVPMDGGGVVVGERISINLEVEAVLRQADAS
jgi:polyisoprenoid-binding protein YceI